MLVERSFEEMADSIRAFMIAMLHSTPQGDLGRSAAAVLGTLQEVGPQRVTTLALDNGVTQPAMTALVQRLEMTGRVIRVVDPSDSRSRLVAITKEGVQTLFERRNRQNAAITAALEELDEAQIALLNQLVPTFHQMSERLKS